MPDPFAAALDVLHSSVMATEAVYRPAGGGGVALRVVRDRGYADLATGDAGAIRVGRDQICVRRADVPAPAIGDSIDIGDETFRVSAAPMIDAEGVSWWIEIEPERF